jgi:hypothetical protein
MICMRRFCIASDEEPGFSRSYAQTFNGLYLGGRP